MLYLISVHYENGESEAVHIPGAWCEAFVPEAVALGIQSRIYSRESARGRFVDIVLVPQTATRPERKDGQRT